MDIDPSLYWWAAAFLLLFLELYTRDLSFLVLSAAIMVAAITVAVGFPFIVQILTIGVIVFLGYKFFRPWALEYIPETARRKTDWIPTFSSSRKEQKPVAQKTIMGQIGVALTTIDRNGGVVRVGKNDWQATLYTASGVVEKGTEVRVMRTEGNIAVVVAVEKK